MSSREQSSLLADILRWSAVLVLCLFGALLGVSSRGCAHLLQTIDTALFATKVSCVNTDGTLRVTCKSRRHLPGFLKQPPQGSIEFTRPNGAATLRPVSFALPFTPRSLKGVMINAASDLIAIDCTAGTDTNRKPVRAIIDIRGLDRELNALLDAGARGYGERQTRHRIYTDRLNKAIRARHITAAPDTSWAMLAAMLPAEACPVRPPLPRRPTRTDLYSPPEARRITVSASPSTLTNVMASAMSGSLILLQPGEYDQPITVPSQVTLASETLHQAVFSRSMTLGDGVTLIGLKFFDVNGPAVRAADRYNIRIEECQFSEIYEEDARRHAGDSSTACAITLTGCDNSIVRDNTIAGLFSLGEHDAVGILISGGSASISRNVISEVFEDGHCNAAGIAVRDAIAHINNNVIANIEDRAWKSAYGIVCRNQGTSTIYNNTIVALTESEWDDAIAIKYDAGHGGLLAHNVIDRIEGYGWNQKYGIDAIRCGSNVTMAASNMVGQLTDTDARMRIQPGTQGEPQDRSGRRGEPLPFLDFEKGDLRLATTQNDTFGAYATNALSAGHPSDLMKTPLAPYEGEEALQALRGFVTVAEQSLAANVLHVTATATNEGVDSGTNHFESIRAAISAASAPCEILVGRGTFSEGRLRVPSGVSIRGQGRRVTVVTGSLTVLSDCTLSSLTIRGWQDVAVKTTGRNIRILDTEIWPTRDTCKGIESDGEIDVIGCHIHGVHGTKKKLAGGKPAWEVDISAVSAKGTRAHIVGSIIHDIRKQGWVNGLTGMTLQVDDARVEHCVLTDIISPASGGVIPILCTANASAVIRNNTIWRCGALTGGSVTGIRMGPGGASHVDVSGNLTGGMFSAGRSHGGSSIYYDAGPSNRTIANNCGFPQIRAPGKATEEQDAMLAAILTCGPEFRDAASGDYRIRQEDPLAAYGAYAAKDSAVSNRLQLYKVDLPIFAGGNMSFDELSRMLQTGKNAKAIHGAVIDKLRSTPKADRHEQAARFLPLFLEPLEAGDSEDRVPAGYAIAELYYHSAGFPESMTKRVVSALIKEMETSQGDDQLAVSRALCRLGAQASADQAIDEAQILEALEPMLLRTQEKTGATVALNLRMLKDKAVPLLIQGLSSDKYAVVCNSIYALGEIGPTAKEALPEIRTCLTRVFPHEYQNNNIKDHVRQAIAAIGR